jgi:hypothetical protein
VNTLFLILLMLVSAFPYLIAGVLIFVVIRLLRRWGSE